MKQNVGGTRHRILLVDDHPVVREGLAKIISNDPGLTVCGETDNVQDALKLIEASSPDLAVVDLSLRESSGLDLISKINQRPIKLPVLVLSMHQDCFYAERVLRSGVRGFLDKSEPGDNVLSAIHKILNGEMCFNENLKEKLLSKLATDKRHKQEFPLERLSNRELEVFEMIGQGHSTRIIAQKLQLSIKTIETYRAKIKDKLELADATQLLQRAVQWVQHVKQDDSVLQD